MHAFVQSLDAEARKWFRELPAGSINGIEVLEEVFMNHQGNVKDNLYYTMDFALLKRKVDESIIDFTKRFNKMNDKIPAKIKLTKSSAKLAYANSFDADFSLLLRERRPNTLINMQEETLEVE